jgi:hypothetical protein
MVSASFLLTKKLSNYYFCTVNQRLKTPELSHTNSEVACLTIRVTNRHTV